MNPKYKGIDLEKIKQVQEIRFSHIDLVPEMVKVNLKSTFSLDNFKASDAFIDAIRLQIEAHQTKQCEDKEMFIICEMAKLFLEEKEKQKKVMEQIELQSELFSLSDKDCCFAIRQDKALKIIKEGMG